MKKSESRMGGTKKEESYQGVPPYIKVRKQKTKKQKRKKQKQTRKDKLIGHRTIEQ
jgi:hypothetical protein